MRKADLDKKNRSSMKIRKAMRKGISTALATAMVVGSVNFTAPTNVYGEETGALVPVEQEKKSEDDAQENAASNTEANAVSDAEEVKDAVAEAEVNEETDSNEADVATETEEADPNTAAVAADTEKADAEDAEASEDEADAEQAAEIADSEVQIEIAALEPQAVSESAIKPVMTSVATTFAAAQPVSYKDFTEDEVVADLKFGSDVTEESLFETSGQGFSTVEFKDEAKGWSGNVYYPRVATTTDGNAAYVKAANGSLAISSKVWTETESTGYGVYTYENTSTYEMSLPAADYMVEVTFVNPTDTSYTAYAEAEEITKTGNVEVGAGETKTVEFKACLVDEKLSLKFLAASSATSESAAATQTVYVSNVKVTRLATNAAREDGKPTIFIASDSTVQSYDAYYNPQTGWGQVLAEFFGDGKYTEVTSATAGYGQSKTYEVSNAVVENRAIGGRSSSSFILEGKYDDLLEDIRPGDYVLVQWGHNDSTYSRPNRYVSSADFEKWMQYYVDGAIQRGATPILVTPVARYSYTTDSEGKLISFASNFEAYRQVMIKMSREQGIALVDLTQRSIDIANDFGIDGGKSLWLYTNAGDYTGAYAGGSTDSTHLQWYGAYKFAQAVAAGIMDAGNSAVYANENNASEENKAALSKLAGLIDLRAATTAPGATQGLTAGTIGASSISMSWSADSESELYYIYRAEVSSEAEGANYVFADDAKKYSVSRNTKYTDTGCEGGKTYVYAIKGFNSLGVSSQYSQNIVVSTKSAGFRFDFNYNNSATQEGWTGINQNQMYDKEVGYGWITAPGNGRSRGNNGTVSDDLADMAGDFNLGAGEFAVDLPNGDYEVTIYAADLLSGTSTIKPSYSAEGEAFGGISCKQSLGSVTGTARVTDGQLNIIVGGTNMYINGLTITEILKAPTALNETEASVSGSTYTALLSFVGIDDAAGYNYYVKGSTDKEFKLERSFDKEKYALGVTEYGAISVKLGENYEYYVTAYTADGSESAPSNTVSVKAQLDVATPAAPANVVCTSPAADADGVKESITIAWDNSVVENSAYPVIKYIVYRSDKAETDKGFKGFVKIGETSETSFTDNAVKTNIHYYYKVCASNAGGAGDLSVVCETPITGALALANEETLTDRALYAINLSEDCKGYAADGRELTSGVYLSWRAFEEEFDSANKLTTSFTVYVNGQAVAQNLKTTNVVLEDVPADATFKVVGSADENINGGLKAIETKATNTQYVEMQLYKPADETMPDGSTCNFTANDMSVGDVDGDGQLELIVKWYPSNAKDNSGSGYTGKTFIDTYDVNWNTGATKLLSRIDLGVNIRSGAHYTQYQVWDFNGDGKAEVAVKTADGTTTYASADGTDATLTELGFVGACSTDELPTNVVSEKNDYRNGSGYVLAGPEYFSIISLESGNIIDTVAYTPGRGTVSKWGDAYGNRVDRFLSATAYLDGEHPFAVMCRGYYTRTALTAYGMKDTDGDGIGDKIYTLWAYDTDNGDGPEGQGNHNLAVADVDNDGKDEIVYGSSCYDHDGTLKYSTGYGHGDALHISDWIPSNPGLEVMEVHEEWNQEYQVEIHDAETGKVLIGYPVSNADVGRGVASDIDPRTVGAEFWASNAADGSGSGEWDSVDSAVYSTENSSTTFWDAVSVGSTPSVNATLYWDGDLLAELQDHVFEAKNGYYPISTYIAKWDYVQGKQVKLLDTDEVFTSNGTKGNLGLIADLTGDWRDEFVARCSADDSKVRLYQTTYVTNYVIPCALDDLQYREGVAWENVGYNQPTHTSYLISKGLVTAKLSEGTVTNNSVQINFTPANDGDLYGHEITAYEIYRNGEKIETVAVKDLSTTSENSTPEVSAPTEPVAPVKNEYKFDFGAGDVAEGYTQVKADAVYSKEAGYGFVEISTAKDGTAGITVDDEALNGDNVTFYDKTTDHKEFVVDLPNGNYTLTYAVAGKNVYNAITAEGQSIETNKMRFGSAGGSAVVTADVEVTDGQLNLVATLSKSGYFNIVLSSVSVVEADADFAARQTAYESAKAEYDAYMAAQESKDDAANKPAVDSNYGVVKNEYKFDFGAGAVAEGYTQVKSGAVYSEEAGYGFTSIEGLSDKTYKNWNEDENAALYNDAVLGWIANGSAEFKVDLPNGTYDVTYTIANGSGAVYDLVTAEGVAYADVRRGNSDVQATSQTITVEVTDGQLNFVNTVSKSGFSALYFTAIEVIETEESFEARVAEAKAAYEVKEALKDGSLVYTYTDKNLAANETYTYAVAAVVDGKTSYLSKELAVTTAISIKSVKDFELDAVVEGTEAELISLLPATVKVVDDEGSELDASVTWDVASVDMNKVGEYEVVATIKGYDEKIVKILKVVANELKGIANQSAVNTIVGSTTVELPKTVDVEYTNGKAESVAVIWDLSTVNFNVTGEYPVNGTIAGYDQVATIVIKVVDDYPVSADTASIEVAIGDTIVKNLPEKVVATMASGKTKHVAVTWKTEGVDAIDTSKASQQMIHGTVDGLDADILCDVVVTYKALYKFDLGISNSVAADGWTTVTVNAKGGKKTASELGVAYTEEKGYGFLNPDAVFEGRTETVTGSGLYPTNVVTDFALMTGQTFVVDVPNGDYLVQVMTNCGIGSTSATVAVEGVSQSFSANKNFTVKDYTVTVEDGQLTIADSSSLSRIGAIVVRQISVAASDDVEDPSKDVTEDPSEDVTEESTEDTTKPSTEEVTEPSTEAVTEPSTEAVTEPSTEAVTEATTEAATQAPTQAPTESSTASPEVEADTDDTSDDSSSSSDSQAPAEEPAQENVAETPVAQEVAPTVAPVAPTAPAVTEAPAADKNAQVEADTVKTEETTVAETVQSAETVTEASTEAITEAATETETERAAEVEADTNKTVRSLTAVYAVLVLAILALIGIGTGAGIHFSRKRKSDK